MREAAIGALFYPSDVLGRLQLFDSQQLAGENLFALSLALIMSSIGVSRREIHNSVGTLDLSLGDIESSPESG